VTGYGRGRSFLWDEQCVLPGPRAYQATRGDRFPHFSSNWGCWHTDSKGVRTKKAKPHPENDHVSNNRLSARIDAVASSLLRAHRFVTDERLALSPEAIRTTAVSRDDVLLVL
jgi:hypothetical protein